MAWHGMAWHAIHVAPQSLGLHVCQASAEEYSPLLRIRLGVLRVLRVLMQVLSRAGVVADDIMDGVGRQGDREAWQAGWWLE